jgi:hypothetical protein
MQGNRYTIHTYSFAITYAFIIIIAQPKLQQRFCKMMTEIMLAAPPGVIAVGMGYDGFIYRLPGVDIKIRLSAI